MTFYTKDAKRTQTTWGPHGPEKTWHAYIDADIQDQVVIEQAKQIVDGCSPQRYGPHGAQAYPHQRQICDDLSSWLQQ